MAPQAGFGLRGTLGTISIVMSVTDRATRRLERIATAAAGTEKTWMRIGYSMRRAGVGILALGASINAVFQGLEASAVPVERSLARLTALAHDTGISFDEWYDIVKGLSREFIIMPEQAADSLYHLASAGVRTEEEIRAVARASMQMATIHGEDVVDATESALGIARAYGIELENIEKVTNVMNAAVANSLLTLDSLSQSMKYAAPTAALMGVSLESLTATLMAAADAGIKGSRSGRALRTGMIRLAAPTAEARRIMADLGLEFFVLTDRGEVLRKQLDNTIAEIERLETQAAETEARIASLDSKMEEMSLREREARLMIRRIRYRAAREGRELTAEELERIERIEMGLEGLAIQREALGIEEARERQRLQQLGARTDEAREREEELASQLEYERVRMKDLDQVLQELGNALLGMGAAQRAATLDTLLGKRAVDTWLSALMRTVPELGITREEIAMTALKQGEMIEATRESTRTVQDFVTMLRREGETGAETAALFTRAHQSLVWSAGLVEKSLKELDVSLGSNRERMAEALVQSKELSMWLARLTAPVAALGPYFSALGGGLVFAASGLYTLLGVCPKLGYAVTNLIKLLLVKIGVTKAATIAAITWKQALLIGAGAIAVGALALVALNRLLEKSAKSTEELAKTVRTATRGHSIGPDIVKAERMARPALESLRANMIEVGEASLIAAEGVRELEEARLRESRITPLGVALPSRERIEGGLSIGEIRVEVTTGPVSGVEDVEEIANIVSERIVDKIRRCR